MIVDTIMMMRGRGRAKGFRFPTVSSLSVLCGSALFCLVLVSIIFILLLDLGDFHRRLGHPSFPFPGQSLTNTGESSQWFDDEPNDLTDVPGPGDSTLQNVWNAKDAELFYGCSSATSFFRPPVPADDTGYVMIEASGGLNQQRTGITDSVVVARILNATLVVPKLDHASFWHDTSNFSDIFDVDHFIASVAPDVRVVKSLPLDVRRRALRTHVPRKSLPQYYDAKVLPRLLSKKAVVLPKFDYRLASTLEEEFQKLRCRVNYKALRFTQPIAQMGQGLVDTMRKKDGRYIALHLRFEPDMLAFSGCYYGGGQKEIFELGEIRKRWPNLPDFNPEKARRNGKCPLSPTEMGLLLRASGFGDDTNLYVASGEVYGGEETLAPLKLLFPKFFTKESLSTEDELRPFQAFSSRMAAIDYIVCDESDVFAANNNGNMARILAGHRRFSGHKRTIRPNARKLSPLFLARHQLGWGEFAEKVRHHQKGYVGDPNERPGRGEFHENPEDCICKRGDHQSLINLEQDLHSKGAPKLFASDAVMETGWSGLEIDVEERGEDYVKQGRIMEDDALEDSNLHGRDRRQEVDSEEIPLFSD